MKPLAMLFVGVLWLGAAIVFGGYLAGLFVLIVLLCIAAVVARLAAGQSEERPR